MKTISLGSIMVQLGAIIALPVIVLIPIAVLVDRRYDSMPFAIIIAFVASACISAIFTMRLIKK